MNNTVVKVDHLRNRLGGRWVHDGLNLTIRAAEIVAVIGESGSGKTTLLQSILKLRNIDSGTVDVFGINIYTANRAQLSKVRSDWGVMFQNGALFSSMSVLENIIYPIVSVLELSKEMLVTIAQTKLALVGLNAKVGQLYPAELSGGMKKRVALARAIALDPALIVLDEPTAGLDPVSAASIDNLILQLRQLLQLSVLMVTHDLDTLWRVPDRVIFLGEGRVIAALPMVELVEYDHPLVQAYFVNRQKDRSNEGKR